MDISSSFIHRVIDLTSQVEKCEFPEWNWYAGDPKEEIICILCYFQAVTQGKIVGTTII